MGGHGIKLKGFSVIVESDTSQKYTQIFQELIPEQASSIASTTKQHTCKNSYGHELEYCIMHSVLFYELTCLCFMFLLYEVGMEIGTMCDCCRIIYINGLELKNTERWSPNSEIKKMNDYLRIMLDNVMFIVLAYEAVRVDFQRWEYVP